MVIFSHAPNTLFGELLRKPCLLSKFLWFCICERTNNMEVLVPVEVINFNWNGEICESRVVSLTQSPTSACLCSPLNTTLLPLVYSNPNFCSCRVVQLKILSLLSFADQAHKPLPNLLRQQIRQSVPHTPRLKALTTWSVAYLWSEPLLLHTYLGLTSRW